MIPASDVKIGNSICFILPRCAGSCRRKAARRGDVNEDTDSNNRDKPATLRGSDYD